MCGDFHAREVRILRLLGKDGVRDRVRRPFGSQVERKLTTGLATLNSLNVNLYITEEWSARKRFHGAISRRDAMCYNLMTYEFRLTRARTAKTRVKSAWYNLCLRLLHCSPQASPVLGR